MASFSQHQADHLLTCTLGSCSWPCANPELPLCPPQIFVAGTSFCSSALWSSRRSEAGLTCLSQQHLSCAARNNTLLSHPADACSISHNQSRLSIVLQLACIAVHSQMEGPACSPSEHTLGSCSCPFADSALSLALPHSQSQCSCLKLCTLASRVS